MTVVVTDPISSPANPRLKAAAELRDRRARERTGLTIVDGARERARDLCRDLNATRESEHERRRRILRDLFGRGGDCVWMQPPFYCDYGANIELGERVFFNFNCVVLDVCPVRIGDFTLFWTGVYPEIADRMRHGRKDSLLDYTDQGKRNYFLASTIPAGDATAPDAVLKRLSDNFELCVYGLGEVRRQWSERDGDIDPPLLLG